MRKKKALNANAVIKMSSAERVQHSTWKIWEERLPVIMMWTVVVVGPVVTVMLLTPICLKEVTSMFMLFFINMDPMGHDRLSVSVSNVVDTAVNHAMFRRGPTWVEERNPYIQGGVVPTSLSTVTCCGHVW